MAAVAFQTPFFAPQARLVDAATNQVIGEAAGGKSTPHQADVDLVSAKVTLGINTVGQLQVVLNNQRHADGLPVFPPWKYNKLQQIKFGQRLRLDLRYGDEAVWHKMIVARVTDLQFSFPQSGASQLTVIGEDLLSLLKTKSDKEKPYSNHKEDFIVRDVLVRSKAKQLQLDFVGTTAGTDPLKGPLVPWPALQPLRSITHSKDTSYLQFLQNLAERMDFEIFVDFSDRLILDNKQPTKNDNDVKLHFEPARSVVKPVDPLALTWGTDLDRVHPEVQGLGAAHRRHRGRDQARDPRPSQPHGQGDRQGGDQGSPPRRRRPDPRRRPGPEPGTSSTRVSRRRTPIRSARRISMPIGSSSRPWPSCARACASC